ncbi:MAG: hypothetical protein KAW47_04460 [Thermoplasmatales archaeon]|nr:hypothetical protein [Thermoplasmatales archaeon]
MDNSQIVQETDVLIATIVYLVERGVHPYRFSIPRGKGIDTESAKNRIVNASKAIGQEPSFSSQGPDISAISEKEWWHVECKGAGSGKAQTQRTNFDRALASVVSYYEDKTSSPEPYQDAIQYLGLALPATHHYLRELKKRVRKPLRKKLNLWVLLYEIQTHLIRSISPDKNYEDRG